VQTNLETTKIGMTDAEVTRIGMGGAPLGNVGTESAVSCLETAYSEGIRYFDTAPLYGAGVSESHYGKFLPTVPRETFTISTKVGRLILSEKEASKLQENKSSTKTLDSRNGNRKASKYKNQVVFNFSRDGILRSIEDSLERLGLDSIDIVLIHDPDDFYEEALNESFPALAELREQGVIKAIGAGMNEWEMLTNFAKNADFDCFLLAGRYTLLDHSAMHELMPICDQKEISLILGGPYNSGILASDLTSDTTYFYEPSPSDIVNRARAIKNVCDRYQVPLKAAALQFGLMHPTVATTIPGPREPEELKENIEMASIDINSDLWKELKQENLIHQNCPE
jgi:D-threo-aldose 1-dehydrogenase